MSRHPESLVCRESHVSNTGERVTVRSDHALSIFIGKKMVESLSEIINEHFAIGSRIDHVVPTCKFIPGPLTELCAVVPKDARGSANPKESVGVLRVTGERFNRQPAAAIEHAIHAFFGRSLIRSEQKKHDQQQEATLRLTRALIAIVHRSRDEHCAARLLQL